MLIYIHVNELAVIHEEIKKSRTYLTRDARILFVMDTNSLAGIAMPLKNHLNQQTSLWKILMSIQNMKIICTRHVHSTFVGSLRTLTSAISTGTVGEEGGLGRPFH